MSLSCPARLSAGSGLSGGAGGFGLARGGGGASVGFGHGGGASLGLGGGAGLALGGGAGLGLGGGAGLGLGGGAAGLGLGGGAGLGLGGGLGYGAGGLHLGLGSGAGGLGLGLGGGAGGLGLGFGGGAGGLGLGLGGGAGYGHGGYGGGHLPSAAFTVGRTLVAGGGLGGGSAILAGPALAPTVVPVLSREAEKQTLSSLNDRFSTYVVKMKALQQENAALEAKLSQLTGGTDVSPDSSGTSTVEYESQLSEYRGTLENLTLDTIKLEIELDNIRGTAHEVKAKFDFEQGVKFQLEADIAAMKKDIELASELRLELDTKVSGLRNDLDFIAKTQEEELSTLQAKLGTTTVDKSVSMIEVDTGKSFDISVALNKIRDEYEKVVQQNREEAEAYYRLKMDEIQTETAKNTEAVASAKTDITAARKELQGLTLELQGLASASLSLEHGLAEAQAQSSVGVAEYQAQIASLTSAIEIAKADLHKQILAYQELLDVKQALDVEISTYRKLLEGSDIKFPDSSLSESSYSFSAGFKAPQSSTPQDSSVTSDSGYKINKYTLSVGSGNIQVKEIITEHIETSLINDGDDS